MQLKDRIDALIALGQHLKGQDEYLEALMQRTKFNNPWFTIENQEKAINAIADFFLSEDKLHQWLGNYEISEEPNPKGIGLVLAGNIPLVGFHDVLSVFAAGHKALVKLSEKDQFLLPYLFQLLEKINPATKAYFQIQPKLSGFDAVIATGSNNSARYFESYFGKYPHIIRKNRNAVAILTGQENSEELKALGQDVFQFFGLGCRNVAKVYVPENYNFDPLLEALHEFRTIINHTKYKNNFDYNYAMYMLNKEDYKANGCIILTENKAIVSRIASLHYEHYSDTKKLEEELTIRKEEIQCVVGHQNLSTIPSIPFGRAQQPELWDYADGVDTMAFLLDLNRQ